MTPPYVSIKNLEQYQHYKHRNPPWVKLHYSLLDDDAFLALDEVQQCRYMKLILLASRQMNCISTDPQYLAKVLRTGEHVDVTPLIQAGFLLSSRKRQKPKMLSSQHENRSQSRDRVETEKSREKNTTCSEQSTPVDLGTVNGHCPDEWKAVEAHLKTLSWLNRPELYDWEFWRHLDTSLSAFPDLSVVDELSKAEAWLIANPRKAKTKKRWKAFLLNWFHFAAERKARYEKGQVGRS